MLCVCVVLSEVDWSQEMINVYTHTYRGDLTRVQWATISLCTSCATSSLAAQPKIAVSLDGFANMSLMPHKSFLTLRAQRNRRTIKSATRTNLCLWLVLFLFSWIATTWCCSAFLPPALTSLWFLSVEWNRRQARTSCVLCLWILQDYLLQSFVLLLLLCVKFALITRWAEEREKKILHTWVKQWGICVCVFFNCICLFGGECITHARDRWIKKNSDV